VSFEVSAEAYDRYMGRWSRRLASDFADFAGVGAGMRVLDVGCGTGALTEELLVRLPTGSVSAVDPSASFVGSVSARLPDVEVTVAAAESLPFPSGSFDAALALLVVHFMADPVAGLSEMARVTRPGGVITASVWDFAGDRGPVGVFWGAARHVRPDAPGEAHLPGTHKGHLAQLLETAGLHDVAETTLIATIEHPSFEDWWAPFTAGAGPAGAFVSSLDVGTRERLKAECRRRLPDSPIIVTAAAWSARGIV
jgi:SAM-dependent methyltransferase